MSDGFKNSNAKSKCYNNVVEVVLQIVRLGFINLITFPKRSVTYFDNKIIVPSLIDCNPKSKKNGSNTITSARPIEVLLFSFSVIISPALMSGILVCRASSWGKNYVYHALQTLNTVFNFNVRDGYLETV